MKQTKTERITKESKYMVAQTVWYVFGTKKNEYDLHTTDDDVWCFSGIAQKACNLNTDCDLPILYPLTSFCLFGNNRNINIYWLPIILNDYIFLIEFRLHYVLVDRIHVFFYIFCRRLPITLSEFWFIVKYTFLQIQK